jgi:hypothetical protein
MFASRPGRDPDHESQGIKIWVDEQKRSLFVIVRKDDPKANEWQLVETHSGPHGGEFRFERATD